MKTILIERKQFACVAEAVAFFFRCGFATIWEESEGEERLMRRDDEEVRIVHRDLLMAEATRIKLVGI